MTRLVLSPFAPLKNPINVGLSFSMHDLKTADLILVNSRADRSALTWYSIRESRIHVTRKQTSQIAQRSTGSHIRMSHMDDMCHINVSHSEVICHIQKSFIIQALSVARSKRIFG
jgi:hypothetical protein